MATIDTTEIKYSRATRDYDILDDGHYIGSASTYSQAEQKRMQYLAERRDLEYTATELDGGVDGYDSAAEQALTEFDNRNPAMVEASVRPHYTRRPAFDNERHGCAWVDRLGLTLWRPAGIDPNS